MSEAVMSSVEKKSASDVAPTAVAKPKAVICPSMLSSDFSRLLEESKRMLDEGGDWLHMDVMDGHFVPNLTIGAPVIRSLRRNLPTAFLDCHLMVTDPLKWVDDFAEAGASQYTFHIEATEDASGLISEIKAKGMKVGIAIKPKTELLNADGTDTSVMQVIKEEISRIDLLLVMTVEPGFGGQSFMEDMMSKVKLLRERFPLQMIQVDGGLKVENVHVSAKAGANVIVSGSGVFKYSEGSRKAIQLLREGVQTHFCDAPES